MKNQKSVIILGAGGHATVLIELLKICRIPILGVVAPTATLLKNNSDIAYLGDDAVLQSDFSPDAVNLVNGLGGTGVSGNLTRQRIFEQCKALGYTFETLVHPSAIVASTVIMQEGVQVMAGAILQPNVFVGANSIINTRASIDHDCTIFDHVHIAPGAILCGNITIQEGVHVGVGANIIQGITVGKHLLVNAGSTVIRDMLSKIATMNME